MRRNISILVLALVVVFAGHSVVPASPAVRIMPMALAAEGYFRTELYFGRSIPGGGIVSDEEWEKFLAEVVTPRFPDGFTILKATGQYRETNGKIDKELSEVLIFLYSAKARTSSRRKIEEIRRAYVKQFKQEAVLRVDFPSTVNITFK